VFTIATKSQNTSPTPEEELKILRQQLADLQKERQRENRLLASVLHDIRSPLNVVLVASKIMCDEGTRPERRQRNAQLLQDAATNINTLCQDFLDYSKLSAGQMQLSLQNFELRDCIFNIAEGLKLLAQKKRIDLAAFVEPDCPSHIHGDPGRLRQVLVNLMSNSLKFTHQGSVHLEVKHIEQTHENSRLKFSVKDTGMGIHSEKLASIFTPFEQAHGRLSVETGGAGLGLAISAQLVECMGGKLTVSSQAGRGSVFEFEVTFATVESKGTKPESSLKSKRILIFDEIPETQADLESACLSLELHPTVTTDGIEFVRLLSEAQEKGCPYPLAIVNLLSGGGDALFIVEQIHPEKRQATKFLAYTVQGQRGDAFSCQESGVHGYLTGAITADSLELILTDLLQSQTGDLVTLHNARCNEQRGSELS